MAESALQILRSLSHKVSSGRQKLVWRMISPSHANQMRGPGRNSHFHVERSVANYRGVVGSYVRHALQCQHRGGVRLVCLDIFAGHDEIKQMAYAQLRAKLLYGAMAPACGDGYDVAGIVLALQCIGDAGKQTDIDRTKFLKQLLIRMNRFL